jgi:NlpC/P60 family protein/S-layer family protein
MDDNGRMRSLPPRLLIVASIITATLIPARTAFAFTDVPKKYWDYSAIQYVAVTNTWMQDYGPEAFRPTANERRDFWARALVQAYAPDEPVDPSITFSDLPSDDPRYPYANVAVKLGWIQKYSDDRFVPMNPVVGSLLDFSLIKATGVFEAPLAGLASIHEADGSPYIVSERWPHMVLAHHLGLHYNHSDETKDFGAKSKVRRDEAAYSLWKAVTLPGWRITSASIYNDVELPALSPSKKAKHDLTQAALDRVGAPYIWSGEWYTKSPPGYCCGYQPKGGFDCSGFAWWVMKRYEDGYNAAKYRSYAGWSIHDRSSKYMAKNTKPHVAFSRLYIGDLMFFASNGGTKWSDVDHVGVYVGNHWMMHSSGSSDGPVLEWVGDGWYHDHFVYGRRLIGAPSAPGSAPQTQLMAGDSE